MASKIIAGTVKSTQQEVLDLSEKSRAEKKVVAEKVFFGATNLAAKKAEKPKVHVRYADYDENGRFIPLDRMGGKIEVRWVAKCGKVGYTAFEGSLACSNRLCRVLWCDLQGRRTWMLEACCLIFWCFCVYRYIDIC